ncbi:hypothetical protein PAGU2595_023960 [Lysobacter xanthus]
MLFVGNSLTYVGNLPAVFSALCDANGRHVRSDMIVRGGATLSQRWTDGSVATALHTHDYAVLVLQERGGDLVCAFGPESCAASRRAIVALAGLAHARGVKVVLLGTYQSNPDVSAELVAKESSAADEAGAVYAEVATTLPRVRAAAPELTWFAADGMHPGPALTLLDATALYRAVFGSTPRPAALSVRAPIYASASGLTEALRASDAPAPRPGTPAGTVYPSSTVRAIVAAVDAREH